MPSRACPAWLEETETTATQATESEPRSLTHFSSGKEGTNHTCDHFINQCALVAVHVSIVSSRWIKLKVAVS